MVAARIAWFGATAAFVTMIALAGSADAAPVKYRFTTDAAAFGGPTGPAIPFPSPSLFDGGTSGTFVYDSEAPFVLTLADGASLYSGAIPSSVSGITTTLSDLSGAVAGFSFSDSGGQGIVGNDSFLPSGSSTKVDFFQLAFDPPLSSPAPRNLAGFTVGEFILINFRMFWIEGQTTPGLVPDFLSDQDLPAALPSFTGRVAFDFIQTGNPAATSFVFFDGLRVVPAAVTEPATLALLGAALASLGLSRRRKRH